MKYRNYDSALLVDSYGERILNLALSQDLETTTGQFFTDRQKELNNDQPDIDSRKKLWEITNNLIGI